MRNYKYKTAVKATALFLAIIFAALSGVSALSYIRKAVFFGNAGKNEVYSDTPAFSKTADIVFANLTYLRANINSFNDSSDFEDFRKTDAAQERIRYWKECEERALRLFDTIQELKKLKPEEDTEEETQIVLYYDNEEDMYYDPSSESWITSEEIDIYYPGDSYIVYDYYTESPFSNDYSDEEITDEELFRLEKSYDTFAEWNKKYQLLRREIFEIVDDATSHKTIIEDIETRCEDNLLTIYEDFAYNSGEILNNFTNIHFIITDNKTGNTISNIANKDAQDEFIETLRSSSLYYAEFDGKKLKSPVPEGVEKTKLMNFLRDSIDFFTQRFDEAFFLERFEGCSVYLKLDSDVIQGDSFYNSYNSFKSVQGVAAESYLIATIIFALLSLSALVSLCVASGKLDDGSTRLLALDKAPFILPTAVIAAGLCGIIFLQGLILGEDLQLSSMVTDSGFVWLLTDKCIACIIGITSGLFSLLFCLYAIYVAKNIKAKDLGNRFIIVFTTKKIKSLIKKIREDKKSLTPDQIKRSVKKHTIIPLTAYVAINTLLFIFSLSNDFLPIAIIGLVIFNCLSIVFASLYLSDIFRLMRLAEEIRKGNLNIKADPKTFVAPLRQFAVDLDACRDNFETAINEAIKGEHLKTELITNVSHDLKTPLTSIINYVNLLKLCKMQGEDAEKYLDILDDKSRKLQRLIEDLTEASKASSGNIKMNISRVDLNEMALQAVGENSDILDSVGLDLILTRKEDNVLVKADSQRTFRIIDNLFSNAKKYSLSGTRVYVDVYKTESHGIFSIKNISKEKLNITPEELTERFVRGDNSRSTDGSGLGLSIVQSFAKLQNGIFEIEIDGDMFIARLKLPLAK